MEDGRQEVLDRRHHQGERGQAPAQAEGTLDKELDEAVFAAEKGELVGPVKTQYGYYVFEVGDVIAASQQTLAEAKETIKQTLAAQNQQKAIDAFVKDFTNRWKDRTECSRATRPRTARTARSPHRPRRSDHSTRRGGSTLSPSTMIKAALTLLAVVSAGIALTACGGVPGNAVATVDGVAIDKAEFDHWMTIAARSTGQANVAVPDPANGYHECVAAKRKAMPGPSRVSRR